MRVIKAFGFSLDGLRAAFGDEAAFREVVLMALVGVPLGRRLSLSPLATVLIVFTHVLTLVVELLNTGIEAAIDRIGPEIHSESKKAKDCGSAAQLVMLVWLVALWGMALAGRI